MLTSILPWINKFIPIIKKRRKKLKCLIFRFWCNDKIRLFCSTELYYITLLSLAKNFWVFISCTVLRNKLIDMFINNNNGVIIKNLSLFFFPSDIKLAWKAKQKQWELTKNSENWPKIVRIDQKQWELTTNSENWPKINFFYFFDFFLKIQDIRKSKTPIFESG